jgi:hypothetical protein
MRKTEPKKVFVDDQSAKLADRYNLLVRQLELLNHKLEQGMKEIEVCLGAVLLVRKFLDSDPSLFTTGITRPYNILTVALRDVKVGGNASLFRPPEGAVKHRPARSSTLVIRGAAAAYLEILHEKGMSFNEAANFIVKELNKINIKMVDAKRPIERKTVITWRDKMNGDITGPALDIYRRIKNSASGAHRTLDDVKKIVRGSLKAILDEGISDPGGQ